MARLMIDIPDAQMPGLKRQAKLNGMTEDAAGAAKLMTARAVGEAEIGQRAIKAEEDALVLQRTTDAERTLKLAVR